MNTEELVNSILDPKKRDANLVNEFYTHCIPYFQQFLGNHWHTGYYPLESVGLGGVNYMEEIIAKSAQITQDSHVLDVGCGIGGPSCYLAKFTGARFCGLSPNDNQLKKANELAIQMNVAEKVHFDCGFAEALPYPDQTFDAVLFFESACHFPNRSQFFKEAWRVLRPGGRLAGEDWLASDTLGKEEWLKYIEPICQTWAIPSLGTRSEYQSSMEGAGFKVKESVDLRQEMALDRCFHTRQSERDQLIELSQQLSEPMEKTLLEGRLHLGRAVEAKAFTIGRFLAVKS